MPANYNSLYSTYKDFVVDEQKFNTEIKGGNIDWYENIAGTPGHFRRDDLDVAASSEPLTIKRIMLLNAFEHIAAADRAYALRKLDYGDYFNRRDDSFSHDNKLMENILTFFQSTILTRTE